MKIYYNGSYRLDACGSIFTGKASAAQLKKLRSIMSRVMARIHYAVKCDDNELADYNFDIKVKSPGLKTKQVFFLNSSGNTCARGSNPDTEEGTFYDSLDSVLHDIGTI